MQTKGQSVLDHGNSVWNYTQKILKKDLADFKVPSWLEQNYDAILASVLPESTIKKYNVFHDCGKPFCKVVEDGVTRFPNHAEVSERTWNEHFKDEVVGRLIGLDMLLHTGSAEEILAKKLSKEDYLTLLITALAELHSNAEMFGGIKSNSFKIKWKVIDRRGKMIVREVLA